MTTRIPPVAPVALQAIPSTSLEPTLVVWPTEPVQAPPIVLTSDDRILPPAVINDVFPDSIVIAEVGSVDVAVSLPHGAPTAGQMRRNIVPELLLIGLAVGGVLGGVLGFAFSLVDRGAAPAFSVLGAEVLGAAFGGTLGILLGATIPEIIAKLSTAKRTRAQLKFTIVNGLGRGQAPTIKDVTTGSRA